MFPLLLLPAFLQLSCSLSKRKKELNAHDVIFARVTVVLAVGNYNLTDWSLVGVLGAIGYPVGYIAAGNQSPPFARLGGNLGRSSAMMAAFLGGSAGFLLAYQNSWGRLTGFNPNEAEVRGMKQ